MKDFASSSSPSNIICKEDDVASANKLLERIPEENYVIEWTQVLMREKEPETFKTESSLFIFQLYNELLAISTSSLMEVIESRNIHKIPHKKGPILLGTVNLRGQLKLCISLENLLEITSAPIESRTTKHMLAIEQDEQQWVFPVQHVYGVWHTNLTEMKNVPVTISKSTANYLKGIMTWNNRSIGILEEDLIFYSLKRIIQ